MVLTKTLIHKVELLEGEFGHSEEIAEYLTSIHQNGSRRADDPQDVKYQDVEFPGDKEDFPDVIKNLIKFISE